MTDKVMFWERVVGHTILYEQEFSASYEKQCEVCSKTAVIDRGGKHYLCLEHKDKHCSEPNIYFEMYRAKVPGGWMIRDGKGEFFFYSDPKHEWDGATLP